MCDSHIVVGPLDCRYVPVDGNFQNMFSACRNYTIEIMAIDGVELKGRQRGGNSRDLLRRERNQVWIAAHEAEEFSICRYSGDVRGAHVLLVQLLHRMPVE